MDVIDTSAVLCWEGRSKRARKKPPPSYWEEYVATDEWYVKELIADVPEDELHAALEDSDFGENEGEEEDEAPDSEEEDSDYSDNPEDEDDGTSSSYEGSELSDDAGSLSGSMGERTDDTASDGAPDCTECPRTPSPKRPNGKGQ